MKHFETEFQGDVRKDFYATEEGLVITKTSQDVNPIFERNKVLGENGGWVGPGKELKHVASIPMTVVLEWKKEGIDVYKKEDWEKVRQKLNSPDYLYLRSGQGRI